MVDQNDARLLKDITKDDVLSLFLSRVHPSSTTRAKLSVHMHSQKPPKRISMDAARAFATLVKEAGYDIADDDWREIMGDDGAASPEEFIKHWTGLFDGMDKAKSLLAALPGLVQEHPVEGEGQDVVQRDAHYIQDFNNFKSSLPVSADQGPLVQWGDLPLSHL
jgi:insulysin